MEPRTYVGTVAKGEGRAARLGFPTVNVPLPDASVSGVFAADVETGGKCHCAAAFADPVRGILEAHLIGFSGDLYGAPVRITLREKVRDTARFPDNDALAEAIRSDIAQARAYCEKRARQALY